MKGSISLKFETKDSDRIKSRLFAPEGGKFGVDFKKAVAQAVVTMLENNALAVRAEIEKNLLAAGYEVKKPAYQKMFDLNGKELYTTQFQLSGTVVNKEE